MKKIKNFINFIVEDYSPFYSDIYYWPEETQVIPDTTTKPQTIPWPDTDPDPQGKTKDPLYSLYSKFSHEDQQEEEFNKEEENIIKPFLSKGRKPKY